MSDLNVHACPETGICSIIKGDGTKIDLMPDEAVGLKDAAGNPDAVRQALAAIDPGFAEKLDSKELDQIAQEVK